MPNNGAVVITEKYTVNKCTANRQNTYYAYWGSSFSDIFESQSNTKNINVTTGKPIIGYDANKAFTYNNTAATPKGIAYNLKFLLIEMENNVQFAMFEPVNIRLIARDGSSVPLTATLAPADRREIKLNNLAVLSDTALGAKDVGLTDEDGDGFRDDLKQGAYIQMAFDLKKKEGIKCLEPGKGSRSIFSISPGSYVYYDEACGNEGVTGLQAFTHNTLRVFLAGVNDASKLPEELVENVPSESYIAPAADWPSFGTKKQLENASVQENEYYFKYVVTTPAGVKLQNVKLYRRTNFFGSSAETPLSQPDVAAGTTATFTTTNTASYKDLTAGYLSFDALLEDCNGQTNKSITYSIYLMLKNGDGTYCEVPLVCNHTKTIPAICGEPNCSVQGPKIVSTKVERADNSYGWKDYTMAVRQTRDQVSPLERMRALYLDDIEFISKGEQHTGRAVNSLYYYVSVKGSAKLNPKQLTLKVGSGAVQTLTATIANPVRGITPGGDNYFRWDLTSLLPSGTLSAGATFTAVATYQVMNDNPTNNNSTTKDIQSGEKSFFYTLNNPATDTTIGAEGYHTAQKHCGTALTPVFYIAETFHLLATNRYNGFAGCNAVDLGSNLIYGARRFNTSGAYFTQEFRPARFIKKITVRMPSAYQIKNVNYKYTTKVSYMTQIVVDMNKFTVTDDGTWKTYTYVNPPQGQTGHLPPGMISVQNQYNEQIQAIIQPSCKAKTIDITKSELQQDTDALAQQEKIDSNIEYEDFYYHYAGTSTNVTAVDYLNNRPILFDNNKKPEVKIEATSQLTVKANKREMEATFKLVNSKNYDAPYGWVSIPDVTGLEVLSLVETTGGNTYTYTAQSSITGEKMFFLGDRGGNYNIVVKNTTRHFKLNYKITNCTAALQMKVFAGWNCSSNPTGGYRSTCDDKFITYSITVAKTKKEIAYFKLY